ncbi:MAG: hypothetical protein DI537_10540 [Stutzerimonas stutzeri]|nr:MAG: hypothetical protein DI537_10540 [Stutzerimonas stutzeri]
MQGKLRTGADMGMEWFYEKDRQKFGPITEAELRDLVGNGRLSQNNLVWTESFGADWKPISATELMTKQPGPPPLPSTHIDNTFAWLIAVVPLVGEVIELAVAQRTSVSAGGIFVAYAAAYIALIVLDVRRVKASGNAVDTTPFHNWWIIVPVYLFKRANVQRMPTAPAPVTSPRPMENAVTLAVSIESARDWKRARTAPAVAQPTRRAQRMIAIMTVVVSMTVILFGVLSQVGSRNRNGFDQIVGMMCLALGEVLTSGWVLGHTPGDHVAAAAATEGEPACLQACVPVQKGFHFGLGEASGSEHLRRPWSECDRSASGPRRYRCSRSRVGRRPFPSRRRSAHYPIEAWIRRSPSRRFGRRV